jgi:hypothetical protein
MKERAKTMPHPSLHQDFGEVNFFLALRNFMTMIGFPNFSLRDLNVPTGKRLRIQLSAVINFAKFRDEQLKAYVKLSEPVRNI